MINIDNISNFEFDMLYVSIKEPNYQARGALAEDASATYFHLLELIESGQQDTDEYQTQFNALKEYLPMLINLAKSDPDE